MKNLKSQIVLYALLALSMIGVESYGQNQTFYVAAENGFKLRGPQGFDEYVWFENNTIVNGADSVALPVLALGAATVGNTAVTKTFGLKVKSNAGCWSDEGQYTIHILPKLNVTVSGYLPPYCENLSQQITLTANINGATGATALTLVANVSVAYKWSVQAGGAPTGNAAIQGNTNDATALVNTPQSTLVDNDYKVIVDYVLPSTANQATDLIGNTTAQFIQTVHADPRPAAPIISVEEL